MPRPTQGAGSTLRVVTGKPQSCSKLHPMINYDTLTVSASGQLAEFWNFGFCLILETQPHILCPIQVVNFCPQSTAVPLFCLPTCFLAPCIFSALPLHSCLSHWSIIAELLLANWAELSGAGCLSPSPCLELHMCPRADSQSLCLELTSSSLHAEPFLCRPPTQTTVDFGCWSGWFCKNSFGVSPKSKS